MAREKEPRDNSLNNQPVGGREINDADVSLEELLQLAGQITGEEVNIDDLVEEALKGRGTRQPESITVVNQPQLPMAAEDNDSWLAGALQTSQASEREPVEPVVPSVEETEELHPFFVAVMQIYPGRFSQAFLETLPSGEQTFLQMAVDFDTDIPLNLTDAAYLRALHTAMVDARTPAHGKPVVPAEPARITDRLAFSNNLDEEVQGVQAEISRITDFRELFPYKDEFTAEKQRLIQLMQHDGSEELHANLQAVNRKIALVEARIVELQRGQRAQPVPRVEAPRAAVQAAPASEVEDNQDGDLILPTERLDPADRAALLEFIEEREIAPLVKEAWAIRSKTASPADRARYSEIIAELENDHSEIRRWKAQTQGMQLHEMPMQEYYALMQGDDADKKAMVQQDHADGTLRLRATIEDMEGYDEEHPEAIWVQIYLDCVRMEDDEERQARLKAHGAIRSMRNGGMLKVKLLGAGRAASAVMISAALAFGARMGEGRSTFLQDHSPTRGAQSLVDRVVGRSRQTVSINNTPVATAETAAAPTDAAAAAGDAGPTPEPVAEGGMTAQDAQWSDGETQDWADYLALAKAQGALPTFTVDPQNTVVAALLNEARKAGKPDVGDQKQAVLGRKGKTTNYALFAFGPRGRRPIGIGIVDGEVTVTQGEGQVLANLPNPANKTGKMLQDIGGIGTVPAGWVVTAGQQLEQQGADTFIAMSATTDKKTGKLTLSLNGTEQIKVTSWVPVGDDDGNIIIGAEALPDVPLQ